MIKKFTLFSILLLGLINADTLQKENSFGISYGLMGVGFSYFNKEKNSEITTNIMYFSDDEYDNNYDPNKDESELHGTIHYRKFFKPQTGGWYYGGFFRVTKLEGKLKNEHNRATQTKVGVGAELGYTSFGLLDYPGLYWNIGFGIGPYLAKESEIFEKDELLGDAPVAVHFDIIRLGYVY